MRRLPPWVMLLVGLAVLVCRPFVSGAPSTVLSFLAPLVLVAVYLRGRRDVDEMREARDVVRERLAGVAE